MSVNHTCWATTMHSPLEVLQTFPTHDFSLIGALHSRQSVKGNDPFIFTDQQIISWNEFAVHVDHFARALADRGITRSMRVAIMSRNNAAHVLSLFALAQLGAVMVPVNPDFGEREASYMLTHADVHGIICDEGALPIAQGVFKTLTGCHWVMTVEPRANGSIDVWAEVTRGQSLAPVKPVGCAQDTCIIIYTSGTTGFPKGVMHSQSNLIRAGEANVERLHLQPDDRYLIVLPFFHVNAVFYSLGGVLASGSSMILTPRFSASSFWETAAKYRATVVNIIEAIGTILCNRDRTEYRPDHCIRAAYGVRKTAEATFRSDFGIHKIMSGFGMTEIPGVTCNPWDGPSKPGSMGTVGRHPDPALQWASCRVVDEEGSDVAIGQTGEFWVKTPIVMQGYFRDPEQTAKAFEGGWFKTGDIVRQDADGFFYHLSRKKDIIRRRGENISAVELETVLLELPAVYQAAAIAVPSELGEDDIMVVIVKQPGQALEASEVVHWCQSKLSAIKVPRFVSFINTMPLTPTHKILKAALRNDPAILANATDFQK